MRLASLSKPTEAMPTNASRGARPRRAVGDLAEVDRPRRRRARSSRRPRAGPRGSRARARGRCRARRAARRAPRPGTSRSASATAPTSAVAAEHGDRLAGLAPPRSASSRAWARSRVSRRRTLSPCRAQRPLDVRRHASGPAAAGGGVDDQADGRGHRASVVRARRRRVGRDERAGGRRRVLARRGLGAVAPAAPDRGDRRRARRSRRTGRAGRPARGRARRTAARPARRCRGRSRAAR